MSEKRKIISKKNLPTGLPLFKLAVLLLLLDRYNAPEWAYGFFLCFCLFVIIIQAYRWSTQESYDIMKTFTGPKENE